MDGRKFASFSQRLDVNVVLLVFKMGLSFMHFEAGYYLLSISRVGPTPFVFKIE